MTVTDLQREDLEYHLRQLQKAWEPEERIDSLVEIVEVLVNIIKENKE